MSHISKGMPDKSSEGMTRIRVGRLESKEMIAVVIKPNVEFVVVVD